MKLHYSLLASAIIATAGMAGTAHAATATNHFDAVIKLVNSCDANVATINDLDFGTRTYTDTNIDTSTDITVKCTTGASYDVGLSGTGNMTDGTSDVAYAMYSDAGRTSVWGDTVGTDTVAATGSGANQTHTVYGRVASIPSTAEAGSYSDTVTVTVTY